MAEICQMKACKDLKYKTIVMDFPWKLTDHGTDNFMKGKINHNLPYGQMTDDEILNFNINDFAEYQCDLFLWTTHKKLPLTFKILERWGFKYYCIITWFKNSGLTVNGFFMNSEIVVYGYRGKFTIPRRGEAIPIVFKANTRGHSIKPDEFYELIKPKTREPRIDIFARKRHDGFEAWGDQVENEIQLTLKAMSELGDR